MKEGWEYKKLGEVCDVQNGFAFNSKLFGSEPIGMPLIRIRDIKRGFSETYTSESCGEEFIVSNGDCLIGMDGDFNVGIWKGGTALLNQRVCKLIPSDKVSLKFLYYYIPERLNEINSKTVFTTVKHLSSKQIKEIGVPDISLSEQKRIVSYLDSTFAKIEAVAKNAEESLNQAKALFQSALAKMMEPKEGWEEKNLVEELKLKSGEFLPSKEHAGGSIPVYGGNGITGHHNESNLDGEHIIIGRVGALCGNVHLTNGKIWVTDNAFVATGLDETWDKKFLMYELTSIDLNKYATKAVQPVISNKSLREVSLYKPSLDVQNDITKTLENVENNINSLSSNLSRTLTECAALKQSILRQTFE